MRGSGGSGDVVCVMEVATSIFVIVFGRWGIGGRLVVGMESFVMLILQSVKLQSDIRHFLTNYAFV